MTDAGFRNVMPVGYDAPLPSKDEWEMKPAIVSLEDVKAFEATDPAANVLLTVAQAKTLAKLIVLYPWLEKLL